MAQFGNNLYGASYYGINGVFSGQFVSDKTALLSPLQDLPPDAGESIYIDLYVKHTIVTYGVGTSGMFIYDGTWSPLSSSKSSSDRSFKLQAVLTGSDIHLLFNVDAANGAMVDVNVTEYKEVGGVLQETAATTATVDTKTTGDYAITSPFGNYKIEVTMNTSSAVGAVFEFTGLKATTTDANMELRTTMQNIVTGTWSDWATPAMVTSTFDAGTGIQHLQWTTADLTGLTGYQVKILMASSDNTTTPEITKLWIHSGNSAEYNKSGYWKMIVDLGADWNPASDTIDNLSYVSMSPNGTKVEIRTRVTADDTVLNTNGEQTVTWEYWTIPYSGSQKRVFLDIKNDPGAAGNNEGYIISPLIDPQNLTHWLSCTPYVFVSSLDPTGTVTNNLTSVVVDILDESLNVITMDGKKQSFIYTGNNGIPQGISAVKQKIRIKVTLKRNINQPTPAVDNILLSAEADYSETRSFGKEQAELKGYGSAVFGENTGIDAVYTDGTNRLNLASVSNFGFTLPQADTLSGPTTITNPSYTITNINMPTYDGVILYWASQKSLENKNNSTYITGGLTDDYVMVEVKADGTKIKKHCQYGSGITIKVSNLANDNYDKCIISNAFTPALDLSKAYAYHLGNGFPIGGPNVNVDLRWNSENALVARSASDNITDLSKRRDIVCEPGQQLNASIAIVTTGMMAEWKSEERIFEAMVNIGSPQTPRTTLIHLDSTYDLPEIPGEVVIEENPYKVAVVDGSIVSEGEIRENDRVTLSIDNSFNTYTITSEDRAPIVKSDGAVDYLPKHRTISVEGIYTSLSQYAPLYFEGETQDFIIRADKCTIDWTPAITKGKTIPEKNSTLYVSYTYEKLNGIDMQASCDYNKNEYDMLNIYRTEPKYYTGRCSYGIDYVSNSYVITELWPDIPTTVDKPSMVLKTVVTDNDLVTTRVAGGKVIGTLGDDDPRENWHPHIKDGFYYIGKDQYYLSTSPYVQVLGDTHIPSAENTAFAPGTIGNGLLIQEATDNLFANSRLDLLDDIENVFVDTFER